MIDATEFRRLVEAYKSSKAIANERGASAYVMAQYNNAVYHLMHYMVRHAPELLALVEASSGKPMLIDGDERTTVRIFTPAPEQKT